MGHLRGSRGADVRKKSSMFMGNVKGYLRILRLIVNHGLGFEINFFKQSGIITLQITKKRVH